ncbi:MAG: MFS transporter [Deltaproteobacteria bacterium]|nr:MFS transporter [Deltaproteobacteria bacterium]
MSAVNATARSPLPTLFLTAFIDLLGFGLTIPLMPFYAQRYGASALEVTLLFASYSLMNFLFVPLWGELSDRVGRRPVLLISIAATAFSMVFFALADSYGMLLASRILQGIMTANIATLQAYIADVTKPADRGRAMGLIGAAFGLGFIVGPAVGGILAAWSFRAPGFAAAALATVNFGLALRNLPESLHLRKVVPPKEDAAGYREPPVETNALAPLSLRVVANVIYRQVTLRPLREALKERTMAMLVLVFFIQAFAFTNLESTFALFTQARFSFGAKETGYLFGWIGVVVVIVQGAFYGRLSKRFSDLSLARVGLFMVSVAMLALALIPLRPPAYALPPANSLEFLFRARWVFAILAVSAFGNALINPSLSAATSKRSSADKQGGSLGVQQSAGALARVLGPLSAGLLFDHLGASAPLTVAAVGTALAGIFVAWVPPSPVAEAEAAA